jgi:hypothetical protein
MRKAGLSGTKVLKELEDAGRPHEVVQAISKRVFECLESFDELLAEIPPDWTRPLFRVVTVPEVQATIEMTLAHPHRIIQLWAVVFAEDQNSSP